MADFMSCLRRPSQRDMIHEAFFLFFARFYRIVRNKMFFFKLWACYQIINPMTMLNQTKPDSSEFMPLHICLFLLISGDI